MAVVKGYMGYVLGAGLVLANAAPASAAVDYITNGNFTSTTATTSTQMTSSNVTGWSSNGYNFIFLGTGATPVYSPTNASASVSGSQADTVGASGVYGNVKLWGPGDGSNNGLVNSPAGSNFIAADNNFSQGAISQTVGNATTGYLTAGAAYFLSFYWAGAQQQGFTGTTQEQWTVQFGSQTQATSTIQLASQGFSGWTKVTMYFVASAATQTLSFLATGSPGGNPPFSLLDGVSLVAAPEPTTWAILVVGLLGLGGVSMMRRRGKSLGGSAQA